MTDEVKITGGGAFDGVYNVVPVEPEPFKISEALQAALDYATKIIEGRSFADRHPELGKMINCRVCGTRHRASDNTYREHYNDGIKTKSVLVLRNKCEQVFTYRVDEDNSKAANRLSYELYREDEKTGELVPDYRTAMRPEEKPTAKQVVGAASFAKKRYHPHLSKI